ncbi:MAG TPA: hypothetical protein VLY04_19255 [Bryobacteraceae bacterium]|nr:hypothetical protein [Bryobacteraceae bacterium]
MIKTLAICLSVAALASSATAQEKKVAMKDLPPAVQKTVQEQIKGAVLKGLSMETEKGKTNYEVETVVNGKHRDLLVDPAGNLTEIEQEVDLDGIPAAARAAIQKKIVGGKLTMVESVTHGNAIVAYEASYTGKDGKKHEYAVKPDGTEYRD